jgi:hypothetical protein
VPEQDADLIFSYNSMGAIMILLGGGVFNQNYLRDFEFREIFDFYKEVDIKSYIDAMFPNIFFVRN